MAHVSRCDLLSLMSNDPSPDGVDLITFSWISVSLIQSRGGLPSHKQSEIFDPRCQSQKFCFAFALSFF